MRKTLILNMITAATVMMAASLHADARGGGGGGGGHGHGHGHGHARVGVFIGAPLLFAPWWVESRPYYYYPSSYYYGPPPVVVRERVVVREPLVYYDERGNPVPQVQAQVQLPPAAQPQPGAPAPTWYFCADSQKYYPYVQNCASPWQRVVPQAPPQ